MKEFKCDNGRTYKVPDKSCLVCGNCESIFWDHVYGPYMVICSIHEEPIINGHCEDYVAESEKSK